MLNKLTVHHTTGMDPYSITREYSTILKDKSGLILIADSLGERLIIIIINITYFFNLMKSLMSTWTSWLCLQSRMHSQELHMPFRPP